MNIRTAAALFALALPLCAQAPVSAETEGLFYKAYYLEKGPRDHAQAMALYEQFLAKAPEHKLAGEAAKQQLGLLDRLGKSKERDAFREKYAKLLGDAVATRGERVAEAEAADGDRPARGARGQRGEAGAGGRMDPAARLAEMEKQLAKAKEEGDDEQAERLAQQIERIKAMGDRAGRGQGQARGGLFGNKALKDMTAEELEQWKGGMERMTGMLDRMRGNLSEEQAKKLDEGVAALKKSLEANNLEDAQKALDGVRESMGSMRRGGGGGGEAGGRGQGGRGQGGGGRGEGGGGGGRGEGGGGGN